MTSSNNLSVNPQHFLALFSNRNYEQLSEVFISVLEDFANNIYWYLDAKSQEWINNFVSHFLYLFTQFDYTLSDRHIFRFIQLNARIANIVAISSFKTTDAHLKILINQPKSLGKLLTLYSARNTVKIDRRLLFDANPQLACLWYSCFYGLYATALVNQSAYHNLREHIAYNDERLTIFHNLVSVYFGATYIDSSHEREIKQKINKATKETLSSIGITIDNKPNPKKIGVVTSIWFPWHSVHRALFQFVESLKDDYSLTLIHGRGKKNDLDTSSFQEVKEIYFQGNSLNLDSIQSNEFALIYYPDIGMNMESIILSNLRIAPIQVCGLGHAGSTFGSEIDYFISGADVEILADAELNYSERLILLPGLGVNNNCLNYEVRKDEHKTRTEFIINCSCFSHKVNYPLRSSVLKEIIKQSKKKIVFRFFAGGLEAVAQNNGFVPFVRDLASNLGEDCFEVIPPKPYNEYMAVMEEGDICIHSYPFGGSNTVADSLYLRKLIVTFEGDKWCSRVGSQMLRDVGLSELIATDSQKYINLVLKLIHNDKYRSKLERRLKKADLEQTIFNSSSKIYFKKAIDFLIENHPQLEAENSHQPILIQ